MFGARRLDVGGEHPVGQHAHIVTTLYERTDDGRVCRHGAAAVDDREQVALGILQVSAVAGAPVSGSAHSLRWRRERWAIRRPAATRAAPASARAVIGSS